MIGAFYLEDFLWGNQKSLFQFVEAYMVQKHWSAKNTFGRTVAKEDI